MINRKKILFLLMGVLLIGTNVSAQKKITFQNIGWLRYHNKLMLSSKWDLQSDVDNRRFIKPDKQFLFLLRTQVTYKFNSALELTQGFVYALQSPQDPNSKSKLVIPEFRPHQDIFLNNEIGKIKIKHRYRLEERFFQKTKGETLTKGYNFNIRVRYQFQLQIPLINFSEDSDLKLKLAEEIMVNIGKKFVYNFFDQNRLSAGLIYKINKNFEVEPGYSNWFQQRSDGKSCYSRDFYVLTFFHNMTWQKINNNAPL